MTINLTDSEAAKVRQMMSSFPYRIIYVARKDGESVVSAVPTRRIPYKLAREGSRPILDLGCA